DHPQEVVGEVGERVTGRIRAGTEATGARRSELPALAVGDDRESAVGERPEQAEEVLPRARVARDEQRERFLGPRAARDAGRAERTGTAVELEQLGVTGDLEHARQIATSPHRCTCTPSRAKSAALAVRALSAVSASGA